MRESQVITKEDIDKQGFETIICRITDELAARIAMLLKIEVSQVKAPKSLTSLGLDSISVMIFKQMIEDDYSCSVEIATIFSSPVSEIAEEIVNQIIGVKSEPQRSFDWPALITQTEETSDFFPLTDLQSAYWMGRNQGFELGGVAAHVFLEVNVNNEELDPQRLNQAWKKLINHHPMLRVIVTKDGQQKMLVDEPNYDITYHDMIGLSEGDQKYKCAGIRQKLSNQVIDLDSWPLFEVHHAKLNQNHSILFVSIDLLIADIWSINLLLKEWYQLYTDPQTMLNKAEIHFRDFCSALKALTATDLYKTSMHYWKQRISTLPPAPQLPMKKSPKTLKEVKFHNRCHIFPKNWWLNLKERAATYGITPTVVLMAAFSKILSFWSRNAKFSLNLTLFNRLPIHPNINQIVGDFTSVLVLEVDNTGPLCFAEFAIRLQKQLAKDMEYRYYSGVDVIRDLARAWDKTPQEAVLPVVFTSTLSADGPMVFQSKKNFFGETSIITQTPQVYLDHQVYENDEHVILSWDAVDEVFPVNMLNDMFEAYQKLLKELALNPAIWEQEIREMLPERQKQQRVTYNSTQGRRTDDMLYTQFVRNACNTPEAPAVITSATTITYQKLFNSASYLAGYLREYGIKSNQVVAIMMNKGWEQVVAVLAITMAGGAYVYIDPKLPLERQQYLLTHSQVQLIIGQKGSDALPQNMECFIIDDSILSQQGIAIKPEAKPDDLAYVIYTSGSTGLPKGVTITHRSALNTIEDINKRFNVTAQDKVLALSSLGFDLSVYDIFGLLLAGGAVVVPDPFTERDPDHWLKMVRKNNVTVWNSVPALMEMLVETAEANDREVQLKLALLSGDYIPVTLTERIWKLNQETKVISLGGATEAAIWSIYFPVEYVDGEWTTIPYGNPLKNQRIYVLNEKMGNCPDWVPGDLYIGGDGLALNYLLDKEKTEKAFVHHPESGERIYKTGDLGRFHPEGYVEFLGREDSQIKLGGFRIELGEIESVLNSYPSVRRSVVKKVSQKDGSAVLAGYVVLNALGILEQNKYSQTTTGDLSGESFADGEYELILDPAQRLLFKLKNPGLRFDEEEQVNAISLDLSEMDMDLYTHRSSSRRFLEAQIPFKELSALLECLRKADIDGLKKFRYGSAGGLYPVQVYIHVKENKIEGINGGIYYYHPFKHALICISAQDKIGEKVHVLANQKIYQSSAISIFLVGKLSAIRPLYGSKARDFCLLEAGLITQLLENSGIKHKIGFCQIGTLADVAAASNAMELNQDDIILHVLLGGKVDFQDAMRGMDTRAEEPDTSQPVQIDQELRAYCSQKLPHYMVPTYFMQIKEVPLSAVGKVNYKALPIPHEEPVINSKNVNKLSNEMEKLIHDIFVEKTARKANMDANTSLFELGLNSLTIVRAWRDIIRKTGVDFPVVRVFENPTIAGLAEYLNNLHEEESKAKKQRDFIQDKAAQKRQALLKRNVARS